MQDPPDQPAAPARPIDRRLVAAIVAAYALLVCALWWRVFLRGQIAAWDCVLEYWPDLRFQVDSIRHLQLPTWCPWSLGGYPFLADPQSGFYSPVNWICIAAGLVGGAGAWLIQLKVMLSMLIGLCGMHALAWSRTRSHAAAAVAAVTFVLGSPLLVHKNGAFLWPLLYLPWAVLALARLHDRPTLRRGAALGCAIWLCGSAGHPQSFFYDLVILAAYELYAIAAGGRRVLAVLRAHAPALGVAVAVTGLLLAVIYLPAADAVALSGRAHRTLGYALDGNLSHRDLRELLVPHLDANWQTDIYMGPLALVGAAWALAGAGTRRARLEVALWIAVAIGGVELALGREGVLLPFFAAHVPGFSLFRISYRLKVIFGFAAALLAGDGVAAAARVQPRRIRIAMAGAGAAWLVAALCMHAAWGLWLPIAIVVAAAGAGVADRWRSVAMIAVPLLVLADLWGAGAEKLSILQPRPDPSAVAPIVAALPGAGDRWRYHVDDVALPLGGTLPYAAAYVYELRELSGYGNPIASERQLAIEAATTRSPILVEHFGVRYELGGRVRPADAVPIRGVRGYELPGAAPFARAYAAAERASADAILHRLATLPPSAITAALVERDAPLALPLGTFAPIDGTLVGYAPDRVEVAIDVPTAAILVVNDAWYPGWTATVNGDATAIFRANYLSRGVVVPAGASRVVFEFHPPGYHLELALFALGLVALGLAWRARWPWLDATRAA